MFFEVNIAVAEMVAKWSENSVGVSYACDCIVIRGIQEISRNQLVSLLYSIQCSSGCFPCRRGVVHAAIAEFPLSSGENLMVR